MRFYTGSDHGGVSLRRHLVEVARELGHEVVEELGPHDPAQACDYPDVAVDVCRRIAADPGSYGLIVCGTGQGVAMAANRMRGIRAAVCADVFSAKMARAHNDANVLCLGERVLGVGLARELLEAFCQTEFEGGRHERRVAKLNAI
jgi:ribose 5-phosphate isomerase B